MRLLLVSVKSDVSRGGIATWTEGFLERCNKYDIDCRLVNTEAVGKRAKQGLAKRNLLDEFVRTRRIFQDLKTSLKENYDVGHVNTSCGNFGLFRDYLIARKIKKRGIPFIVHYHCDIPYWIHNPISRFCLGKLARLSDRNVVLCENSRKYLQEQFGVQSVKIPNFIDESFVLKKSKKIKDKIDRIFFMGRVSEAKGAAEIYELAKCFPYITFELVGDVSDTVAAWEKPNNILLAGVLPHEQAIAHLDDADLFLFPSHSEGFSLALMESMARGVPAVATDVGANADMMDDGCGIVTAKDDVNAMKAAIKMLEDIEVRRRVSQCAKGKVYTYYRMGVVMEQLGELYDMLVAR